MRVALYARYSSDQQRDASIEDQFRECRKLAAREGWTVVREFDDRRLSGATILRDGLQELLASTDEFDVVVAESLDRLSRDQEDTAAIFKKLTFRNIKIYTVQEQEISALHVGLKGTMNALYLSDLSAKTRRGQHGQVLAGRSTGGRCYGYRIPPQEAKNRGQLVIAPEEAAIVVRIFQEFVAGASPKSIAKKLNAERIPGPRAGTWGPSTIHGNPKRGTGILNNELYVGRRVWGRLSYRRNPFAKRRGRVSRLNPASALVRHDVPQLRIIDDALWDAAKSRQRETRHQVRGNAGARAGASLAGARRAKYLFSGLVKCGLCGSSFTMCAKDRLGCAGHTNRGTCTNTKTIKRGEVERRVLKTMEERLWNHQLFEEFCQEFTRDLNRQRGEQGGAIAEARGELTRVEAQISKCVDWIMEGWDGQKSAVQSQMQAKLDGLEQRRRELIAMIDAGERARTSRPLLHPNMHQLYRDWVIDARDALQDPERRTDAMNALRAIVQEITITPTSGGLAIVLKGDLAEMLVAAGRKEDSKDLRHQATLVAGAGFEPATFGL